MSHLLRLPVEILDLICRCYEDYDENINLSNLRLTHRILERVATTHLFSELVLHEGYDQSLAQMRNLVANDFAPLVKCLEIRLSSWFDEAYRGFVRDPPLTMFPDGSFSLYHFRDVYLAERTEKWEIWAVALRELMDAAPVAIVGINLDYIRYVKSSKRNASNVRPTDFPHIRADLRTWGKFYSTVVEIISGKETVRHFQLTEDVIEDETDDDRKLCGEMKTWLTRASSDTDMPMPHWPKLRSFEFDPGVRREITDQYSANYIKKLINKNPTLEILDLCAIRPPVALSNNKLTTRTRSITHNLTVLILDDVHFRFASLLRLIRDTPLLEYLKLSDISVYNDIPIEPQDIDLEDYTLKTLWQTIASSLTRLTAINVSFNDIDLLGYPLPEDESLSGHDAYQHLYLIIDEDEAALSVLLKQIHRLWSTHGGPTSNKTFDGGMKDKDIPNLLRSEMAYMRMMLPCREIMEQRDEYYEKGTYHGSDCESCAEREFEASLMQTSE